MILIAEIFLNLRSETPELNLRVNRQSTIDNQQSEID